MHVQVEGSRALLFDDGAPVRGASALARLGDGWLVAQDAAACAAWVRPDGVRRLQVLPDAAADDSGPRARRPDLEAACGLVGEGTTGVLLLGSGSTPAHCGGAAVLERAGEPLVLSRELAPLYAAVATALELPAHQLDLSGVARNGAVLRWFQRGDADAGVPNASVDVGLPGLLEALRGEIDPATVPVRHPRRYDLGAPAGAPLAATDAVALPGGRVLLSAMTAGAGAAALCVLDGTTVLDTGLLPPVDGVAPTLQGLGVLELLPDGARLLAVVQAQDPDQPSRELTLRVRWA